MTDAEVIAEFMEPRGGATWWVLVGWHNVERDGINYPDKSRPIFTPRTPLDLDALYIVEGRLSEEQWERYYHQFGSFSNGGLVWNTPDRQYRWALHATAEQKVKALATVLRDGK